jgi:hypothetical protein
MLNAPGHNWDQDSRPDQTEAECSLEINQTVLLNQWLQGVFETNWQSVETLLASESIDLEPKRYALTFIRRAQPIYLTMQTDGSIDGILVVAISSGSDRQVAIQLQLHAANDQTSLAEGLTLTVIDEAGSTLQTTAVAGDRLLQMPRFQCSSGERFRGVVTLNQARVAIDFII